MGNFESTFQVEPARRMQLLPDYLFGKLNATKLAMRRAGRDVIDFGMGNPDQPTSEPIVEKLQEVLNDAKAHRYSVARGIPHLLKAVTDHYQRYYEVQLDPETQVIATIGSKEGLSHLVMALLGPGDACIVPEPSFPVHVWSAVIAGAQVHTVPLSTDAQTFIASVKDCLNRAHIRPKILFLNYPHNPTTATVEVSFFEKVVGFCREEKLFIIQDFAYKDITFDGYDAPSIMQVPGASDIAVEFITMSKSYNMAGWRCGFCIGNAHAIKLLGAIKGYYDYGLFTPIQVASISALKLPREDVRVLAKKYEGRRDALIGGLSRYGWKIQPSKGAMFVWAPLPDAFTHMGSMAFSELLLEKAEVLVSPGVAFGKAGEGFVRMSLVENTERIKQAVRQMGKVLQTLDTGSSGTR
jgi:alanine-synthesizing transaminase